MGNSAGTSRPDDNGGGTAPIRWNRHQWQRKSTGMIGRRNYPPPPSGSEGDTPDYWRGDGRPQSGKSQETTDAGRIPPSAPVVSMTPGVDVGHWNVFREKMQGDVRNIPHSDLPTDAHDWLSADQEKRNRP